MRMRMLQLRSNTTRRLNMAQLVIDTRRVNDLLVLLVNGTPGQAVDSWWTDPAAWDEIAKRTSGQLDPENYIKRLENYELCIH